MAEYNTKQCAVCGKEIVITAGWSYKRTIDHRTRWYCSWKCLRKDEQANPEVQKDVMAEAEEKERKQNKQPQDRGKTALALVAEIRAGRNPIEYLKQAGYGNPYEAYNAVRHYAETKGMTDVLEVMLPMRQLKHERKKPTGRPRKYKAEKVEGPEMQAEDKRKLVPSRVEGKAGTWEKIADGELLGFCGRSETKGPLGDRKDVLIMPVGDWLEMNEEFSQAVEMMEMKTE